MTKKPIMIDEIDVSGCEAIGTDGWCSLWEENCSKNPDCIHKKYLRKEQECEKIKQDNSTLFDKAIETRKENITLQEQLNQLKAENKEVNNFLTDIASYISYNGETPTNLNEVRICIKDICKANQILDKNAKLYRQTLTEIKEVIKKEGYINKKTQIVKGSILYQALKDLKLPDRKILKIINEVLDV